MSEKHLTSNENITAQQYIDSQLQLEQDARELMPWDPNHCTHHDEPVWQQVFACLTCKEKNKQSNGICYSCSIQCHSTHNLVELFTKRNFSCDCGTTRMSSFGGCNLRKNFDKLDEPSKTNRYGHNFEGRFCWCDSVYNAQTERGTMFQCCLGDACGWDWFHEECILGLERQSPNMAQITSKTYPQGVNVLESLEPASSANVLRPEEENDGLEQTGSGDDDEVDGENDTLEGLPNQDEFTGFICWQCVLKNQHVMRKLSHMDSLTLEPVIRKSSSSIDSKNKINGTDDTPNNFRESRQEIGNEAERESGQKPGKRSNPESNVSTTKKVKLENSTVGDDPEYSLFLVDGYQEVLASSTDLEIKSFLDKFPYMKEIEPVYEPPQDDDANSSLVDAGTKALNQLPREQAIDGMQAYAIVRERVKEFLKPFAEQGKVVTETDVNKFFDQVQQQHNDQLAEN